MRERSYNRQLLSNRKDTVLCNAVHLTLSICLKIERPCQAFLASSLALPLSLSSPLLSFPHPLLCRLSLSHSLNFFHFNLQFLLLAFPLIFYCYFAFSIFCTLCCALPFLIPPHFMLVKRRVIEIFSTSARYMLFSECTQLRPVLHCYANQHESCERELRESVQ